MAEHAAEAPADTKPKKSRKKLIIIALPVLLLAGGAGAYFAGVIPGMSGAAAKEAEHGEAGEHGAGEKKAASAGHGEASGGGHGESKGGKEAAGKDGGGKETVFFDLPDQLVNLNSAGRKTTFLKVSISLELDKKEDVPKVSAVLPRIIDNFQTYMRELKIEDLRGSAGLYRLREELLVRVNAAASPTKVNDVLFREMLVQ